MLTSERKALILQILAQDGRLVAKDFSQRLNLSEDTIRRDLRELASDGLLQRVHGGALPASRAVADFASRQREGVVAKSKLGRIAARMIRPRQVVFMDGGTTNAELVRELPADLIATIVTHSPSIAVELVEHPHVAVEVIGGRLFKHSIVATGASAAEAISRFRFDVYFMGVTGVHPEAGATTGDAEEATIKRLIARQAGEIIVLATGEKLGAASPFGIVPMADITTLVTEAGLPNEVVEPFRFPGLDIVEV